MRRKKLWFLGIAFLVIIISIATYYFVFQEDEVTYQGTFVYQCNIHPRG